MLLRAAARRVIGPYALPVQARIRPGAFQTSPATISASLRTYASASRIPPAPSTRQRATTKQPGSARQTSPGTSIPKSAVSEGPKLRTTSSAPNASSDPASASRIVSPVHGARPRQESALRGNAAPQEPIAPKYNADEPVPGTVRAEAQARTAASENTPAPESGSRSQPLPDLRQGIPSTFDFEFGGKAQSGKDGSEQHKSEDGKLDLTSAPDEDGSRQRGDREYDSSAYETSTDRRRNQMANYLFASTIFVGLGAVFYFARPFSQQAELPSGLDPTDAHNWSPTSMYARMRARVGHQMGYYTEPSFTHLLPSVPESQRQPYTLVLSLEDLMIHTTWDTKHGYRLVKRPGLDYFIRYLSQYYELVLFTSAPRAMADPVMAKLDPYHFIMWPLGREATKYENGEYVKDLAYLNRPLAKTLIIDTHAPHVKNQPENAIIVPKWTGDPKAKNVGDLVALIPFLEYLATMGTEDVRTVLKSFEGQSIAEEFARRESIARAEFQKQLAAERSSRPRFSVGSIAGSLGVKGTGGGMVLADGQSVAQGLREGKMLSDQIREQGLRQYETLEKQIRENGEQWLKEEKEEQQRLIDESMKEMKRGALGWFGGGSGGGSNDGTAGGRS